MPKQPAFAEEKPGDSLRSLPRLPHREPSKSIAPTPIHPPLPSVIRFAVFASGRSACRKRQQRDIPQHRREPGSCQMSFGQHQPAVPSMLDQPPAGLHQPLLQASQRPVFDPPWQRQPQPQVARTLAPNSETCIGSDGYSINLYWKSLSFRGEHVSPLFLCGFPNRELTHF